MKYAYVTFLMRGDSYLPGAAVLAFALKQQTNYQCICLVTEAISYKARKILSILFDEVITINEINFNSRIKCGRSDRDILLTRFEALRLQFDKIILIDADVLPLAEYDSLFQLNTPAGILFNPLLPHGTEIPRIFTERLSNDPSEIINSGLWVVNPSDDEYDLIINALQKPHIIDLVKRSPWPEMQLASYLWSGRWVNIDTKFCLIRKTHKPELLNGIHLAGLKPWQLNNRSIKHYINFPDFILWYQMYSAMYWSFSQVRELPMFNRLWEFCKRFI